MYSKHKVILIEFILPGSSANKFSFRANFLNFFKCPTSGGKILTRLPYK